MVLRNPPVEVERVAQDHRPEVGEREERQDSWQVARGIEPASIHSRRRGRICGNERDASRQWRRTPSGGSPARLPFRAAPPRLMTNEGGCLMSMVAVFELAPVEAPFPTLLPSDS